MNSTNPEQTPTTSTYTSSYSYSNSKPTTATATADSNSNPSLDFINYLISCVNLGQSKGAYTLQQAAEIHIKIEQFKKYLQTQNQR